MLTINCKGRLIVFDRPLIMGIINTTPDSFYKGSRITELNAIIDKAGKMLAEGATFLDLGGQSTRPGSDRVSTQEESDRVLPAIESIAKAFPEAYISIDTYYATVAEAGIKAGAHMINDISAGRFDEGMIDTVARLQVPYILMHMKGEPATMQQHSNYNNVVTEVFDYLLDQIAILRSKGIRDIIADPGFGFAKQASHNFTLLSQLFYFRKLDVPIIVGLSRKATVYKTLGITASEALNGTTVLQTIALLNGANMLRVHDVKEANETIKLIQAYQDHY